MCPADQAQNSWTLPDNALVLQTVDSDKSVTLAAHDHNEELQKWTYDTANEQLVNTRKGANSCRIRLYNVFLLLFVFVKLLVDKFMDLLFSGTLDSTFLSVFIFCIFKFWGFMKPKNKMALNFR